MKKIFKWTRNLFVMLLLFIGCITICNQWIIKSTASYLYDSVEEIPFNDVALVLGTSAKSKRGNTNLYFKYRMEAVVKLFKAGKIKYVLVSGDNHSKGYDEPSDMRDYLTALGVPINRIYLDYAGFRTLDSVVRSKEVFGQTSITIVSQPFHNQRAVFLAHKNGMNAVAFNAKNVSERYSRNSKYREYFAKFKAVLDIYILHKSPKFLGDRVAISI